MKETDKSLLVPLDVTVPMLACHSWRAAEKGRLVATKTARVDQKGHSRHCLVQRGKALSDISWKYIKSNHLYIRAELIFNIMVVIVDG